MSKNMNEKPFEHHSRNGCRFTAERCDLRGGVSVEVPKGLSAEQIIADAFEMGMHHAAHIWPELNGFAGSDTVQFSLQGKKKTAKGDSILELD